MNRFDKGLGAIFGFGLALAAGGVAAAGYGMYPQGKDMGYGPAAGYGAPYGRPSMTPPPRPQRPTPPMRPQMAPYGYGYGGKAMRPGMTGGYGAPAAAAAAEVTPAAKAAAPAASASVAISQMRFGAGPVTIKAGGTVTWTNGDGMPHTVTANDGSFGSQQLGAGGTYTRTFNKAGTYAYYCKLHPSMRGTVVVVDS